MVEVLKSNFEELLPSIQMAVEEASFISVDAEFTGLDVSTSSEFSLFDTVQSRYQKLKSRASNFIICQLGLSTFTKCKDENVYMVQTYIFFIRPHMSGSIDRRFVFQASSLDFLCRYNFDFNKFAQEGIPYLNEVEEQKVRKEIQNGTFFIHHINEFEYSIKKEMDLFVSEWLLKAVDGEELILEFAKGRHEYMQLYYLRQKFPSTWSYVRDNVIVVQKVSSEQRKKFEKMVPEEEEKLVTFFLGFTRVFRMLVDAKKPIIGHNILTDLLLIYHSFHKPLPRTFKEFKQTVNKLFPIVYDTKHIWLNIKTFYDVGRITRESGLFELFTMFKSPPENLVTLFNPGVRHINSEIYSMQDLPHNAGFDSFATGWVFIKICHFLALKRTTSLVQVIPQSLKQHMKAVEPFMNKVNMMWAKLHFTDLAGDDPSTHRPEYLYVKLKSKSSSINVSELVEKFGVYGNLEVRQISGTEALVAVGHVLCAKDIMNEFENNEEIEISSYNWLEHSRYLKTKIWCSCIISGLLCSFLLYKFIHHK